LGLESRLDDAAARPQHRPTRLRRRGQRLAQQALNGDLNDYLNSITAKTKNDSSSDTQYLEQFASLLLGTTSMGYPAPVVDPGESVWSKDSLANDRCTRPTGGCLEDALPPAVCYLIRCQVPARMAIRSPQGS
jgi:hypothetical protein